MTICLDLSAAAHERAGLGRYAASLAQALLPLEPGLTVFVNDPRESRLRLPLSDLPTHTANLPRKRWRLRAAAWAWLDPAGELRRIARALRNGNVLELRQLARRRGRRGKALPRWDEG